MSYKGELPGLFWDEVRKRYFPLKDKHLYQRIEEIPNITPVSNTPLQSGQISTNTSIIKSLKRRKRGRSYTCGICMEEKQARVELPCLHVFCDPCARTWLKQKGHCPNCRQVVDVALHTAEMAARSSFNAESALRNG